MVYGYGDVGMDALSFSVVSSYVHCRIALVVDSGSGVCMAGFTGVAPRAVFLPSVVRPKMLVTLAGMYQKDSFCGLCLDQIAGDDAFALCFPLLSASPCCRASCTSWTIPGPDSADGGAVLSQVVLARQAPDFVRTVCSAARGGSTGAVLEQGYGHCDRCRDPDSVNCLEVLPFHSCCSSMVVDISAFTQRLIPMVLFVQITTEILQFVDTMADFPVVHVVQILRGRCGEDIRAPTVASAVAVHRGSHWEFGHYFTARIWQSLVRYSSPKQYKNTEFCGDDFQKMCSIVLCFGSQWKQIHASVNGGTW